MKKDRVVADVLGEELAITPSDLCNQQFRHAIVGGYHIGEVDTFLERVANVVEFLIMQIRALKEKMDEQGALLEEYREMEDALRNALVSSQRFGEDIIENAKREAHALVQEGRLKKAQTELEAAKIPVQLAQDIRVLQEQRGRLRRDIESVLETHKRLLESLVPEERPDSTAQQENEPAEEGLVLMEPAEADDEDEDIANATSVDEEIEIGESDDAASAEESPEPQRSPVIESDEASSSADAEEPVIELPAPGAETSPEEASDADEEESRDVDD